MGFLARHRNRLRIRWAVAIALAMAVYPISPNVVRAELSVEQRTKTLNEALADFDRGTMLSKTDPEQAVAAYHSAVELFELLIADGVHNGKLYYNLGNGYLQLGQTGRAILNYRRAERLIGSDPQLQANLRYARLLRRNQIAQSGEKELLRTVFFWHYDTSIHARYLVAIGAYVLFWLLLTIRSFVRLPGLGYAAMAILVLWLSAGISVAVETAQRHSIREGVTLQNDIIVRKGNGEAYDPQFKESIHEGVEFTVIDERPGWYKIELPDGNTGWIRQSQAGII